ncbi:peptide MFS transporter [Bacteroides sp. ET71]|uniref:peptide MFS transporter n=1 Tax=Bacteroides sp. ET71 TaxID=2939421 RepID=UPI0020131B06|nr:peptide MFS transporter [Bacteroides sp. ET71]MCL1615142.1 peptide MFS transporter [Bacteroides sp. ET71]
MFKNHPKGLVAAAISNMGERFGYYIMNAVLVLFLCSKFGLSDETSSIIYSVFYCGIYVLSLVGGIIADKTQNYKGTIVSGLIVMSLGYIILSIPVFAQAGNIGWLLPLTCVALFFIAFGNGLFKGNLQAIVGQMYDNYEKEAEKDGPEALRLAKSRRDSGFQIFYVFINIGGLVAPFVAPLLREWWLKAHQLVYNADLPALCHQYIDHANAGTQVSADTMANLTELVGKVGGTVTENLVPFCTQYLKIFNEGIHYSFIASVAAMLISLLIFLMYKKIFPTPGKKEKQETVGYTAEERIAMATEIKQRLYALFAVLGIVIFFWFSFHQNGQSLSLFARDFVVTDSIAPEIWQAVNPFFVIVLTPLIMMYFGALARRGKQISTPKKIAIGMGIAGMAFLFLLLYSAIQGYPSGTDFKAMADSAKAGLKAGPWVLIVVYFFLTVAELFISPLGLSFVSKVAPKHLQGLCQGLWLGATAIGNLFLWVGPLMYNKIPIWQCWSVFFIVCLVSMGVMLGMVKWLERVTK